MEKAQEFADKHDAIFLSWISGDRGPMCGKVKIGANYYFVFYAREWYRKYDGITIPQDTLGSAIRHNAMIVMFVNDEEFWRHSTEWYKGRILHNTMFDKMEVLQKRDELEKPGIPFPRPPPKPLTMEEFFD